MAQKILIIEDSPEFQTLISSSLDGLGEVRFAPDALAARLALVADEFDLILLDLNLPDADGFTLLAECRTMSPAPVVLISGRLGVTDKVKGFDLGAQDYVSKPFEPDELRARLRAMLRRTVDSGETDRALVLGRIRLDFETQRASIRDDDGTWTDLGLTPAEHKLLSFFMHHPGEVLSRDSILENVWGRNIHVLGRTVDRHVSSLRRKIHAHGELLTSVVNEGYCFMADRLDLAR
jgi:DNA-binding response OmpR family regulator